MAFPDFFNTDAFNLISLTTSINKIPNMYGLLNELNVFPAAGVTTRTIVVENKNGVLNLLPTKAWGSPGTLGTIGKRVVRSFAIPHIPHDDAVMPDEVQGVRAFGSEAGVESVAGKVAEKLATMRNKHAITLEHLRMGALKGIILDSDASTLYDLYTEFGITQKVIDFAFSTATTEIISLVLEMKRHMEDNLKGETMRSILVLCSGGFYDSLTTHAMVKKAFENYSVNQQNLQGDYRLGFQYGGDAGSVPVIFKEYRGTATDAAGTARPFIAADEAHAFPLGTNDTFKTHFAPADFNETVNTTGIELYAKQEARKFGRGWDIHTQSNPLPMCHRPELLVKLTKS